MPCCILNVRFALCRTRVMVFFKTTLLNFSHFIRCLFCNWPRLAIAFVIVSHLPSFYSSPNGVVTLSQSFNMERLCCVFFSHPSFVLLCTNSCIGALLNRFFASDAFGRFNCFNCKCISDLMGFVNCFSPVQSVTFVQPTLY